MLGIESENGKQFCVIHTHSYKGLTKFLPRETALFIAVEANHHPRL
ncbi:9422_t:CDS:2 [Funneliformis geosporum]|uniref:4594_t:CDS:1 n=1 Tax=Funneliformis geosporum TaxID=1117311 RepID=A0A9W4T3S8_9GLOM|nr:9422_t:CDS:2 [Funneliformis geosporum]CAI2191478.1 4594_t:CDS:2 [Funneliformis geosporum]